MKKKIDYQKFLNNKDSVLGKNYYYCLGFDIVDTVIFKPDSFIYENTRYPRVSIKESILIRPDGENTHEYIENFKLYSLFDYLEQGFIKELSPEKFAKILLTYGA